MEHLSADQSARRERTLLTAIALSAFGPFATGFAVIVSESTTQTADFVRRTVELAAMIVSWAVFRHLARSPSTTSERRKRLERAANGGVAAAMAVSAVVIAFLALGPGGATTPGGNVYPGLAIAALGLGVNAWFWRRYTSMTKESFNPIIATQARLYLGKSAVDLCVVLALGAVVVATHHPATGWIDRGGSIAVSGYLAWSAFWTITRRFSSSRDSGTLA